MQFWKIHKFRYKYDKVKYVKNSEYVIIICRQHGEFKCTPNNHKAGKNCNKCSVITAGRLNRKRHRETIIKRFQQKHGHNYKYHNVKYVDNKTPVDIWCCKCKKFISQTPMNHLRSGCKDCGINKSANAKLLPQEEILKRFKEIHCNEQYDYKKVDYVDLKTEVTITCLKPDHGDFSQKPREHLDGSGCPICAKEKQQNAHRDTRESFIHKATNIHGDLYDYKKVEDVWTNLNNNRHTTTPSQTEVTIICKLHNSEFKQTPNSHLQGNGCRKCGNDKISLKLRDNRESFIRKAKDVHGELYDYTRVEDVWSDLDNNRNTTVPAKTKVTIICKQHGPFYKTPSKHLWRSTNGGCNLCNPSGYSKISIQWLEFMKGYYNIDIKHAENGGEHVIKLDDKKYFCDGYVTETNTIFEFNGDFWHGNPKVFERTNINKVTNKSFGELYDHTMKKKQILQSKGYKYIDVWERDWRNAIKLVTSIQNIYRLKIQKGV